MQANTSMIDRARVIHVLTDLVGIESINPALVPAGRGELEIARYVPEFLKHAGLAAVADEEFESAGTRALVRSGVSADAAIVMEPTGLEVVTAHKGFAWAEVKTQGRAAHGSRPEEGRDAIAFMGRVLGEIERLQV